jgi:hypothetical protein
VIVRAEQNRFPCEISFSDCRHHDFVTKIDLSTILAAATTRMPYLKKSTLKITLLAVRQINSELGANRHQP